MKNTNLPIAIIGAGPVGLAAAAHLIKNNQDFILFEAEKSVGANILTWGHVKVFSPWEYNIDKASEELLSKNGISIPDKKSIPFGKQIVEDYLKPLSEIKEINENLHLDTKVLSIGRKGVDKMKDANRENLPFSIQVNEKGNFKIYEAKAVIDASGTWQNPNPVGSGGVFAIGEKENSEHFFYGMPDVKETLIQKYANKSVLVVGGGHSAIGTVLALNDIQEEYPKTQVHWLLRKQNVSDVYGGQEADGFKSRGELGIRIEKLVNSGNIEVHTPVFIHQFNKKKGKLNVIGVKNNKEFLLENIDEVISNTGTRPDFSFLREVRFDADSSVESVPELADLIDPNIHSCGTVRPHGEAELRQREKDFYIVGMKSYGRAPTFLMATGYEQVRSIVAYMNGDLEAAKDVRLELPETGVCNSGIQGDSCCGGNGCEVPEANEESSCDTGCGTTKKVEETTSCCGTVQEVKEESCCGPAKTETSSCNTNQSETASPAKTGCC